MQRSTYNAALMLVSAVSAGACADARPRVSEASAAVPEAYSKPIPDIGSRVRIIAPALGPGWRVGAFNQTRQDPPCYLVIVFDPAHRLQASATVYAHAVVRMQISTLYGVTGSKRDPDPAAAAYEGESWLDVRVDSMQRTGRTCPDTVERVRR